MAALGKAISALQNMNSASAVNWALNVAGLEYSIKMNLLSMIGSVGEIPIKVLHELIDYPQTIMAGIIAAKFFPHQSKIVFWGFAVVPLICKSLKYLKRGSKLVEMPDHAIRILGKVTTTGQAIVNCYRAPELRKLIQGIFLTLTCIKDIHNTASYIKVGRAPYITWNYLGFCQSYL